MKIDLIHRRGLVATAIALTSMAISCQDPIETPQVPEPDPGTEEATEILLDREVEESGMYFGDFWKEGFANYYFELSNGEIGMINDGGAVTVPMNEGGYILAFDLWGAISEDHTHPIVPEGVYTANNGRAEGAFDLKNTLAVYNKGQQGDQFQIVNIKFEDGTIDVKHVNEGYNIKAEFTTSDGTRYEFTYTGTVTMTDWSDDEEKAWEIGTDVDLAPIYVTKTLFEEDGCDNWLLRCFDTKKVTSDGLHVNQAGMKFQISLRVPKGGDFAGTYRPGKESGTFEPGARMGMFATGTYCERVNANMSIQYCVMDQGQINIARNLDGTYTFSVNLTTVDGYSVKGNWTSAIEEFTELPQTTLTEDVVCNPLACSQIVYFGDLYNNNTSNYMVFLATELEIVALDIFSAKKDGDDKVFPTGTFTISDTNEAWTMVPGDLGERATPSCYVRYSPSGDAIATAPFVSGTLTVSKTGDKYTFSYEVYDDYNRQDQSLTPHKISGTFTGTLPEFTAPEDAASASVQGRVKRLEKTGLNIGR